MNITPIDYEKYQIGKIFLNILLNIFGGKYTRGNFRT